MGVQAKVPLGIDNTLWQGTHLKDVDYVIGLVVYSGMETRVGMNRKKPEVKCSQIDLLIDKARALTPLHAPYFAYLID